MKKILIVHISLYSGGAERSLINFLKMYPKDDVQIDLLLFRREGHYIDQLPPHVRLIQPSEELLNLYYNPESRLPCDGGLKKIRYRTDKLVGTLYGMVRTGKKGNASKQLRWKALYSKIIPELEEHYDIAMAYSSGEMTYFIVDKVHADRKVAWVHTDYEKTGLMPAFDLPYYEKIDAIASVSPQCVEALKRCFPTLKDRFILLPNLISEESVRTQAESENAGEIDQGRPAVVSVGRLAYPKSPELSVAAAAELRDRGLDFCWYWIGHGDQQQEIAELIEKEKLQKYFKLLGLKKNPYPYIKVASILVLNSVYEGKSMVLDEAKIIGTPIISTEYPTVHDQIGPGEGIIVKYNKTAIADAVEFLLKHEDKRLEIQSELLSKHFGTDKEIGAYRTFLMGH